MHYRCMELWSNSDARSRESIETMNDLLCELDHRTSDRIDVWLLWRVRDDQVLVAVADDRTGERFRIEVRAGERALDVFHHPYAYAAWRGIDTRSESRQVTAWSA
jgi:hypothetical protein